MTDKDNKIKIEEFSQPQSRYVKLPFNEASLIADLSPKTAHADELALPSGREWEN